MSANDTVNFNKWLNEKLRELNTDEVVFGAYILSILESDETHEEKTTALEDILCEIIADQTNELVTGILSKWYECVPKPQEAKKPTIDVNTHLAKLLEAQTLQTVTKERQYTDEERRIREQILAQYSQTPVSEEDGAQTDNTAENPTASSLSGIERNTNVHDVMQLQKDRREQARLESAAKKQKDKDDREKQKQQREEKKEKRKTVKGERRR